jgi:hypothetical protein
MKERGGAWMPYLLPRGTHKKAVNHHKECRGKPLGVLESFSRIEKCRCFMGWNGCHTSSPRGTHKEAVNHHKKCGGKPQQVLES